jgi:hypothetical protein
MHELWTWVAFSLALAGGIMAAIGKAWALVAVAAAVVVLCLTRLL